MSSEKKIISPALSALKNKLDSQRSKSSIHSTNLEPVPLSTIVAIYNKAHIHCYIEYMEGFKLLVSYLTSGGKVPIAYPEDRKFRIPALFTSYALQQIAKILVPKWKYSNSQFNEYLAELSKVERAIVIVSAEGFTRSFPL